MIAAGRSAGSRAWVIFDPTGCPVRLKNRARADDKTYVDTKMTNQTRKTLRNLRGRMGSLLAIALVAAFSVAVPVAYAQSSLDDPSAAQYQPNIPPDGGTAGASSSGGSDGLNKNIGSLPFTGMDLLIVAGVALLLTGTGFALRRLSAPPGPRT
jgi:hypothetical protein